MSTKVKKLQNFGAIVVALALLMGAMVFRLLVPGAGEALVMSTSSTSTAAGSVLSLPGNVPVAAPVIAQPLPGANPTVAADPQCGVNPLPGCEHPQYTVAYFRAKYGEQVYRQFSDIPLDLQADTLYWCLKSERDFDLPCEIILAVWNAEESHRAELCVLSAPAGQAMPVVDCAVVPAGAKVVRQYAGRIGAFKPLQSVVSSAGAVGPGQITAGFLKSYGHDLDENGVVDITQTADNIGTTAEGLRAISQWANAPISRAMRNDPRFLPDVALALRVYNAGPGAADPSWSSAHAPQNIPYADTGVRWIVEHQGWLLAIESCANEGGSPVGLAGEMKIEACLLQHPA